MGIFKNEFFIFLLSNFTSWQSWLCTSSDSIFGERISLMLSHNLFISMYGSWYIGCSLLFHWLNAFGMFPMFAVHNLLEGSEHALTIFVVRHKAICEARYVQVLNTNNAAMCAWIGEICPSMGSVRYSVLFNVTSEKNYEKGPWRWSISEEWETLLFNLKKIGLQQKKIKRKKWFHPKA